MEFIKDDSRKIRNRIIPIFSSEENFTQQFSVPLSSNHPIEDSLVTAPEIKIS